MPARDRYRLPEPKCRHVMLSTMVSSHDDLVAVAKAGDPMASVLVCDRDSCIEDAKAWVWASTHREPIVKRKGMGDG